MAGGVDIVTKRPLMTWTGSDDPSGTAEWRYREPGASSDAIYRRRFDCFANACMIQRIVDAAWNAGAESGAASVVAAVRAVLPRE